MIQFKEYLKEVKEPTGKLKDACWTGYTAVGMKMKNGKKVPNCVPKNEEVEQIDELSNKTLSSYSSKAKDDARHLMYKAYNAQVTAGTTKSLSTMKKKHKESDDAMDKRDKRLAGVKSADKRMKTVAEELEAQFDLIEDYVEELALINNIDSETLWEKLEDISDEELLEAAVDAKGHKSSTGGLTQKGRDAYNAKGANLQAPVTTPPSKLKAGSKSANRRKSFCARMGGMEGAMKKPNGEPTRKALALRKWNC